MHAVRNSEQQQHLVDEMRAEVVEESGAGPRNFAPAIADVRAIPIDAGFEQNDPSNELSSYRVLNGEKITVPASVLEHREQDVHLLRDSSEMSSFLYGDGERLVDDNIPPGTHRRLSERCVGFIGARDYDEIDIGMRRESLWIRDDIDIRKDDLYIRGM